jgi:hypothetical protein
MLKVSFIPKIAFTYSTGGPLLIMPPPMSWKKTILLDIVLFQESHLNIELLSGQRSSP